MSKNQKKYLLISISIVIIAQLLTQLYRPYIYANGINDLGLADTIGSLASVIAACFFFWSFKNYSNKEKNKQIILFTLVYTIIWEPLGLIGIHGTFDWKDIVAGFISGILTYLLKEKIERDGIFGRFIFLKKGSNI